MSAGAPHIPSPRETLISSSARARIHAVGHATLLGLVVLLQGWSAQAAQPGSGLFAERLTAENLTRRAVDGPDAIGGVGDWAVGNGTLCAVISDPSNESVLSATGGVLVDLGHCDRADDQFATFQPMLNLSRDAGLPRHQVETEVGPRSAAIVTSGEEGGLAAETRYILDLDRPTVLRIESRIRRVGDGDRLFLYGDVALHGNRQTTPFGLSTVYPHRSVGFQHPAVDIDDNLSMVAAMVPSDLQVMVGSDLLQPSISYGLHLRSARLEDEAGNHSDLDFLAINGEHFSLAAIFPRPLWVGGGGHLRLLELAQTVFMDLEPGATLIYERDLIVGDRADVSSVTDQVWADAAVVSGRVSAPDARLHVTTDAGVPVTESRPDSAGRFTFRLPPGTYAVRAVAPGGRALERTFRVSANSDLELSVLELDPPALVALPRTTEPMRLVFVGTDHTPDPRLGDDLLDFRVGDDAIPGEGLANFVSLAGVRQDPRVITLPPGNYRVFSTRGPEHSIGEAPLRTSAGETVTLEIEVPRRLFASPRWISADLHVHAEASDDSGYPQVDQIVAFAAQGAEVLVATEHDNVADFGPGIRRLGLDGVMASVIGSELTSTVHSQPAPRTIGHLNVFPIEWRPTRFRNGTLPAENRRLRDLVRDARNAPGRPILQLNHPRHGGGATDNNFYSHMGIGKPFNPIRPLDHPDNRTLIERDPNSQLRDIDFDVMELYNGKRIGDYWLNRADWFSKLLQGEYRPGTAVSDSHRAGQIAAIPRTYVRVPDDRVQHFDQAAFVEALRKGHAYGTTGPLLSVSLTRGTEPPADMGETFAGDHGTLRVQAQAPPWIPVSEVRVYVNAVRVEVLPLTVGQILEIPLQFEGDAFVTVEVEGPAEGAYAQIASGFPSFAFSNPIFVDADGGGWQAPGLPEIPPPSLRSPQTKY